MHAEYPGGVRVACLNHKGGVGKTTCTVNLAAGLARSGWRVLALDADPQAHLTASLGQMPETGHGLSAVLEGRLAAGDVLLDVDGLSLLPASGALAETEIALSRDAVPASRLAEALETLGGFDVMLCDCPPHLGPLTRQVLAAVNGLIVPMTPDFLSLQSLAWLMDTLSAQAAPSVVGIVLNRHAPRKRLHREVQQALDTHFPDIPFRTSIRENVALAEAPSHGQDIFRYAPASAGAKDFAALCREAAGRLGLTGQPARGHTRP